jgi:uncharacterized membrane protein
VGTFFIKFIVTFIVFLGIDAVWLGVIAKNLYAKTIGHLMADKPNLLAALIFYLLYCVGIVVFAINPALKEKSYITAIQLGAFLGCIAYATYDLTNLATLKNWPLHVTIIDIIWGTFLTGSVSVISYLILNKIL